MKAKQPKIIVAKKGGYVFLTLAGGNLGGFRADTVAKFTPETARRIAKQLVDFSQPATKRRKQ